MAAAALVYCGVSGGASSVAVVAGRAWDWREASGVPDHSKMEIFHLSANARTAALTTCFPPTVMLLTLPCDEGKDACLRTVMRDFTIASWPTCAVTTSDDLLLVGMHSGVYHRVELPIVVDEYFYAMIIICVAIDDG